MARQSRSRPTARPAPRAAPAQSRGAATAAAPASYGNPSHAPPAPAQAHAQPQAQQPGMLSQMAATAGSVAVGSTIGHGISNMLFGGSSARAAEEPSPQALNEQAGMQGLQHQQQAMGGISCETQAKDFTRCLEKADLPSCTWYLEQLKSCQAAAAPY